MAFYGFLKFFYALYRHVEKPWKTNSIFVGDVYIPPCLWNPTADGIPIRWGLFFTESSPHFSATHLNGAKHPWLWNTWAVWVHRWCHCWVFQWEFQDPKMEVLYHMFGHILWGYSHWSNCATAEIWESKCIWKRGQCLGQVVILVHHSFFGGRKTMVKLFSPTTTHPAAQRQFFIFQGT